MKNQVQLETVNYLKFIIQLSNLLKKDYLSINLTIFHTKRKICKMENHRF